MSARRRLHLVARVGGLGVWLAALGFVAWALVPGGVVDHALAGADAQHLVAAQVVRVAAGAAAAWLAFGAIAELALHLLRAGTGFDRPRRSDRWLGPGGAMTRRALAMLAAGSVTLASPAGASVTTTTTTVPGSAPAGEAFEIATITMRREPSLESSAEASADEIAEIRAGALDQHRNASGPTGRTVPTTDRSSVGDPPLTTATTAQPPPLPTTPNPSTTAPASASSQMPGPHTGHPGNHPEPGAPTVHDAPEPTRWTVAPGDHFWSIAERTVGERAGQRDVARYWRALVAANEDRLVVVGNADLLLPGQVLVLPDAGDVLDRV